jgi:hypothetical protein
MYRLQSLSRKYNRRNYSNTSPLEKLRSSAKKYARKKQEVLAELALLSTSLSIDIIRNAENELALQALEMTNPNFDPANLDQYSDMELMGIINSSKGKYFELLVVEKLNSGEAVGNLVLPDGYSASLATSPTQTGWDIQIVDEQGMPVEYLQLKATESVRYISQTLENYPEIRILATDEVAGSDEMVLDSDIANVDMTQAMHSTLESEADTFFDNFIEGFNPLLPLLFIVGSQGYKVVVKKSEMSSAMAMGKERARRALTISTVGAAAYALGFGWFTLPFTIGTGVILEERKKFSEMNMTFGRIIPQLQLLNHYRNNKRIGNGVF